MSITFSRKLIEGRIAEVVFEQMMRDEGKYTIIPFGYEHTVPTLAQYRHLAEVQRVIDNIADAPDFVLISEDKSKIYLVDVKYQNRLNLDKLRKEAAKLLQRWEYPWLFVATPEGFRCGLCTSIVDDMRINNLSERWVAIGRQREYLKLLKEFKN